MKKFIIAILLTFCLFTLAVSAAEHTHDWDVNETTLTCVHCATQIVIDDDNLLCEHKFDYFENESHHGDKCMDCEYAVLVPHNFIDMGFEDGFHIRRCAECDYVETHLAIEKFDETGHHQRCLECSAVETIYHKNRDMIVSQLNENFHVYKCIACGYLKSEVHDMIDDTCFCGYEVEASCNHENSTYTKIDDIVHLITCQDCGYEVEEEHCMHMGNNYENCELCDYYIELTVEYGIITNNYRNDEDDCFLELLVDGEYHTYNCFTSALTIGDFVRVKSTNGDTMAISHFADYEIVNSLDNLDNLTEFLYSKLLFNYRDEISKDSITVSEVVEYTDDIIITFEDDESIACEKDMVVYNMTTSSMDTVEENDIILYFNPTENQTIILIIG